MRVEVKRLTPAHLIVESPGWRHEGLVIHGYGGNKEEILGLAVNLAGELALRVAVFDLSGHGDRRHEELTLDNCRRCLAEATALLSRPSFFVGHSLGARVGLMSELAVAVALSPPGEAFFQGNRRDLINTLRVRQVSEQAPLAGLAEILGVAADPPPKTLLLTAAADLASVKQLAKAWMSQGISHQRIAGANHNDIVSSPLARKEISKWLLANLP